MITEDDIERMQARQNAKINPETREVLDTVSKQNFLNSKPILDEYIFHRKKVSEEFADMHLAADIVSILVGNYQDIDKAIAHTNQIHKNMIELLQKLDKEVNR